MKPAQFQNRPNHAFWVISVKQTTSAGKLQTWQHCPASLSDNRQYTDSCYLRYAYWPFPTFCLFWLAHWFGWDWDYQSARFVARSQQKLLLFIKGFKYCDHESRIALGSEILQEGKYICSWQKLRKPSQAAKQHNFPPVQQPPIRLM